MHVFEIVTGADADGESLLNAPEDIEWLFDAHLEEDEWLNRKTVKSFTMKGNEDSPSRIWVFIMKEPVITSPAYLVLKNDD